MSTDEKKGGKKKWLIVLVAAAVAGTQAAATAGVVRPVFGEALALLANLLGAPA